MSWTHQISWRWKMNHSLTFWSVIRQHEILPNTCNSTGCWANNIASVASKRRVFRGNAYHGNWSKAPLICWNEPFSCSPNSQTPIIDANDQIIWMDRTIILCKSFVPWKICGKNGKSWQQFYLASIQKKFNEYGTIILSNSIIAQMAATPQVNIIPKKYFEISE